MYLSFYFLQITVDIYQQTLYIIIFKTNTQKYLSLYSTIKNMYRQIIIPSFDPSISSSYQRDSSPQDFNLSPPDLEQSVQMQQNKQNDKHNVLKLNKKLYYEQSYHDQLWQLLQTQQTNTYNSLIAKHQLLQQSIRLHHQALKLRNSEFLDCEQRISQINRRIKQLTQTISNNQQKIVTISLKCQQTKQSIENIRTKKHKQQAMIIQQEKHMQQISNKINRIRNQIKELNKQIKFIVQKQLQYEQVAAQNENLFQQLTRLRNQATFAKIKVGKNLNEEESILKKMKQLESIIRNKEKGSRQLGKKLLNLRKTYPEAVNMMHKDRNNDKTAKLQELNKNIRETQMQEGKIQRQIIQITQKFQNISQKTETKRRAIQILKIKQKNQAQQLQKSKKLYQTKQQNTGTLHLQSADQSYQLTKVHPNIIQNQNNKTTNMKKKPIGYKVIESQQNQNFVYPTKNLQKYTIQKREEFRRSSQKIHINQQNFSQRSNNTQQMISQTDKKSGSQQLEDRQDKQLQVTQSLKKLLSKFQNIKNNSVFKH